MREDSPHRVGMQRGVADPIAGADFPKQRPGFAFAPPPARPRTPAPGRFRHIARAAGRSRPPAPPGRSCPGGCAAAARRRRRRRLRRGAPPARSGAARRRSRTAAARGRAGRGRSGRRWRAIWRSIASVSAAALRTGRPCGAQHALQRSLDGAMRRVPRQIVEPVHFSQRRQPPADGGRRVGVRQAGEVGADGVRRGRHGDEAVRGAPVGKMRPVGFVGAQRGRRGGLPRQRLGGCERGLAGRGQRRSGGRGQGARASGAGCRAARRWPDSALIGPCTGKCHCPWIMRLECPETAIRCVPGS